MALELQRAGDGASCSKASCARRRRRRSCQPMVRWLLDARQNGRWGNTQENAVVARIARRLLQEVRDRSAEHDRERWNRIASHRHGDVPRPIVRVAGRSARDAGSAAQTCPPAAERDLAFSRAGTGRLYYATRLQYALDRSRRQRPTRASTSSGATSGSSRSGNGPAATAFAAGDLIRVTLTVTVPQERRYVAVTDPLPAGVEAVDSWFRTTASDLAKDASAQNAGDAVRGWWFERGGFDHVEKYDDRVALFATRLAEGQARVLVLVRATTAGTFRRAGTRPRRCTRRKYRARGAGDDRGQAVSSVDVCEPQVRRRMRAERLARRRGPQVRALLAIVAGRARVLAAAAARCRRPARRE